MRSALLFLRMIPAVANWLVGSALIIWVTKALWLDSLPEGFSGAYSLGTIVTELLSAVVAGYIGYLAFVLFPQFREEQAAAPYLQVHIGRVVGDCSAIAMEINHFAGTALTIGDITEETARAAFKKVLTTSHPRMVTYPNKPTSWFSYFEHQRNRTRSSLELLERQVKFFGADLAILLAKIDTNDFFTSFDLLGSIPVSNSTLEVWAEPFVEYALLCRQLIDFHDRQFVPPAIALHDRM